MLLSTNKLSEMQGVNKSAVKNCVNYVSGVDEAGRGPLAGPVVAAAVILPFDFSAKGINDSKKLSDKKREFLFDIIRNDSICFAISEVWPREIEKINIREASKFAMEKAAKDVSKLIKDISTNFRIHFLVDGNFAMKSEFSNEAIVKGDSKIISISAASILAKVHRDRVMCELDKCYPRYDLSKHKGYPTKSHKQAIAALGPSEIHRRTFSGVKEHL